MDVPKPSLGTRCDPLVELHPVTAVGIDNESPVETGLPEYVRATKICRTKIDSSCKR